MAYANGLGRTPLARIIANLQKDRGTLKKSTQNSCLCARDVAKLQMCAELTNKIA